MIRLTHTIAIGAGLVLLGGCSWLPGSGAKHAGGQYSQASQHGGQYSGQYARAGLPGAGFGHCQVPHAQAAVPQGCDPAAVTIGLPGSGGAFPQSPQFAGGYGSANYATGGYGTATGAQAVRYEERVRTGELRKPKLRGQLALGVEKSISGNFFDFGSAGIQSPINFYDETEYFESSVEGSQTEGQIRRTDYISIAETVRSPTLSHDDVYSTPLSLSAGLEYIVAPRTTVFANAGYTVSEGKSGNVVQIDSRLERITSVTDFSTAEVTDPDTGEVSVVTTAVAAPPQTTFIPNVENTASFALDFTDMRRIDLEAGARHYFNPLAGSGLKKVSPFVGASAGASHFNGAAFTTTQTQAFLERSFNAGTTAGNTYQVIPSQAPSERTEIYDDQWVPRGAVNAGLEWQATPRTALAFETGIQIEGGRKYVNGTREDENISIPLTIRGSYNF